MLKFLNLFILFLFTSNVVSANNEIHIRATVVAHANAHMKTTRVDRRTVHKDIYLNTNHGGLTIALSKNEYNVLPSVVMLDNHLLTDLPMDLSEKTYEVSTKVGNLMISRDQNLKSVSITIAVK